MQQTWQTWCVKTLAVHDSVVSAEALALPHWRKLAVPVAEKMEDSTGKLVEDAAMFTTGTISNYS